MQCTGKCRWNGYLNNTVKMLSQYPHTQVAGNGYCTQTKAVDNLTNPAFSQRPTNDRRSQGSWGRFKRTLGVFFYETQLFTLECVSIFLQLVLIVALSALAGKVILTPPPIGFTEKHALVLPLWFWIGALLFSLCYHAKGWVAKNSCQSRAGALCGFITMLALSGAVMEVGPGFAVFDIALCLLQGLIICRLHIVCISPPKPKVPPLTVPTI
jgi:hypothetical protein